MIVIGIDPGINTTGYSVVEEEGLKLIHCGIWRLEDEPFPLKLFILSHKLRDALITFHPKTLAIEEPFHSQNPRLTLEMGKIVGVLTLVGMEEGVAVEVYSPLKVKEAVTGYGRAEKKQVREMVKRLLKLTSLPKEFDVTDAVSVALCSILHRQWREKVDRIS